MQRAVKKFRVHHEGYLFATSEERYKSKERVNKNIEINICELNMELLQKISCLLGPLLKRVEL